MNKLDIVTGLRDLATELQPFTQRVLSGARSWNGTAYVTTADREPDPFALMWWASLNAIADLIDAQSGPLNEKQIDIVRAKLFSGMGSFSDFCVDAKLCGETANDANQRLNEKRAKLFQHFA